MYREQYGEYTYWCEGVLRMRQENTPHDDWMGSKHCYVALFKTIPDMYYKYVSRIIFHRQGVFKIIDF